ncbi:MAG: M28 family peptidase [Thermoproteota archaeon]
MLLPGGPMHFNNLRLQEILSMVSNLAELGEAAAGSTAERKLAGKVKSVFEGLPSVSAEILPVPLKTWIDRGSSISVCGEEVRALALPPHPGSSAGGPVAFADSEYLKGSLEDKIAVLEDPGELDVAASLYAKAVESGAAAVIFHSRRKGVLRRFVVGAGWRTFTENAPIPALYIDGKAAELLSRCGREVEVRHGGAIVDATGYIVEAHVDLGQPGGSLLLAAHHDHWLGGANDNLASVAAMAQLARELLRVGRGSVTLVSLTAEEIGGFWEYPQFSSYGSRLYAEYLSKVGAWRDLVIYMDSVAGKGLRVYAPALSRLSSNSLGGKEQVVFSTLAPAPLKNFVEKGFPAVMVSSFPTDMYARHSTLDTPQRLNRENLALALSFVKMLSLKALEGGANAIRADLEHLLSGLIREAERYGSLQLRSAAYRLSRLAATARGRADEASVLRLVYRKALQLSLGFVKVSCTGGCEDWHAVLVLPGAWCANAVRREMLKALEASSLADADGSYCKQAALSAASRLKMLCPVCRLSCELAEILHKAAQGGCRPLEAVLKLVTENVKSTYGYTLKLLSESLSRTVEELLSEFHKTASS